MRKASLFSFLGPFPYDDIAYQLPSGKNTIQKFVQLAILEEIQDTYDQIDLYLFLTEDAKKNNWDPLVTGSLRYELQQLDNEKINAIVIDIPDANDEATTWELFEILINHIKPKDTVHFDMTNGFRSIPFLSYIVLQYAKNLKDITFGGLFYGAIIDRDAKTGILNNFTEMMNLVNWTDGVNQYVRTGNASTITQLVQAEDKKINQDEMSSLEQQHLTSLQSIASKMNTITENFETVRSETIFTEIEALHKELDQLNAEESTYLKALLPVLDKVREKIKPFKDSKAKQITSIVDWCIEHGLYQQAYTFLLEFIVNGFCEHLQINKFEFSNRSMIQSVIYIIHNNLDENEQKWRVSNKAKPMIRNIIQNELLDSFKSYFHPYLELNKDRNNINHAGVNTFGIDFLHFERNINKYKIQLYPLIEALYEEKP